jgi:hypothetical protein
MNFVYTETFSILISTILILAFIIRNLFYIENLDRNKNKDK